jgi:hypothetical protein
VSVMFRRALSLAAVLAVLVVAPAAAAPLTTYTVPTGGFSLGLPRSWVDVTGAAPAVLKQLERVKAFRAFAQAASASGALKLIAADPSSAGKAYMDVGVERVGAISLQKIAAATRGEISTTLAGKAKVTATIVHLAAGPAELLHVVGSPALEQNETDEYMVVRDQIEYVLVYVAPTANWSAYASTFARSAATFTFVPAPDLHRVVLTGAQVGSGYKLAAFPGGTSFIGETTLDLCAGTYPSETLRTGRLQVSYSHPANTVGVSNEVVTYAPGGAQLALAEVAGVARSCAQKPVTKTANGVTTTFKTTPLPDRQLPPGAVVVKIEIQARSGKKRANETGVAIYQVKGNTLSGVYTFVAKGTTFAQAERVAFHAALESARNLGLAGHAKVKPKPKSGGGGFVA